MWRYFLSMVLSGLQMSVKNPKSLLKERDILKEIRDNINLILAGMNQP